MGVLDSAWELHGETLLVASVGSRRFYLFPETRKRTMSGHSKWATTKHKKAANDAKRSKEWAKAIKNIEVAARVGGVEIA